MNVLCSLDNERRRETLQNGCQEWWRIYLPMILFLFKSSVPLQTWWHNQGFVREAIAYGSNGGSLFLSVELDSCAEKWASVASVIAIIPVTVLHLSYSRFSCYVPDYVGLESYHSSCTYWQSSQLIPFTPCLQWDICFFISVTAVSALTHFLNIISCTCVL